MDFAEQLESVAYVICGEELITFDKFCQIWHVKGVSACVHKRYTTTTGAVAVPGSTKEILIGYNSINYVK